MRIGITMRIFLIIIAVFSVVIFIFLIHPDKYADIFKAIEDDDFRELAMLLDNGVSPNMKINANDQLTETTILNYSLLSGAGKCSLLLIERGSDPNGLNYRGNNALMNLIDSNRLSTNEKRKILDVLLDISDINHQNVAGDTALHFACKYGTFDEIRTIILHGANKEIENVKGLTAADVAKKRISDESGKNLLPLFD